MSKKNLVILTVIVLLGIIGGVIAFKIHQQGVISEGEKFFNRGDYQKVIDMLGPKVEGTSGSAAERILTAQSLYRLREYDRAQAVLDPLLRSGSEDPKAVALSGWIWIERNSPIQAQGRFNKASRLGLEAESKGGMGAVALLRSEGYRRSDLDEALILLRQSISKDPSNPLVHSVLSELKTLQHEYDDAIESAQEAVRLAPKWAEPYVLLGRAYLLNGKHAEAEDAFKKGLENGASESENTFHLARSLYFQGRLSEALKLEEELLKNDSGPRREALLDAAKICQLLNREENAVQYLQEAWSIKNNPLTGMQLYQALDRSGRDKEAKKILDAVLANWPFVSEAHLERGHRLLQAGDIQGAYSAYQTVLDNESNNFIALYNLGYISTLRGDLYQAPDYFEAAVENYEAYFPAQINFSLSQLAIERELEMRTYLQGLARKYPDNPFLLQAQALERFLSGDSETSLRHLEQSLKVKPGQAGPYVLQGEILIRFFQFEHALAAFEEALKIDKENLRAQIGVAHASYRLGDYPRAAKIYSDLSERKNQLPPSFWAEARNGTGLIHFAQGDFQAAMDVWESIQANSELGRQMNAVNSALLSEREPTSAQVDELKAHSADRNVLPETMYNLALFLELLGRYHESLDAYENLLKRYPSYLPALYNLAELYRKRGRYTDADILFERAHKAAPNRVDSINNQAAANIKLGQYEKAEALLKESVAIDPDYPSIRFNQVLTALERNQLPEAESIFNSLKTSSAPSGTVRMAEGLILAKKEEWQLAERAFDKARQQESGDPFAPLNQGIALTKLRRYAEAENALQEAVNRDPSLGISYRVLGLLYCNLGLFEEAEEALRNAIRFDPSQEDVSAIITQIRGWMDSDG